MLSLKLKRIGKKHQASFRLIVDEKRHKMYGRNVEDLGWYNPRSKKYELKKERISHWLGAGAQPTDTVHNLLVTAGVVQGAKRAVHKVKKAENGNEKVEAKPEGAPAGEAPKEQPTAETPKVEKAE